MLKKMIKLLLVYAIGFVSRRPTLLQGIVKLLKKLRIYPLILSLVDSMVKNKLYFSAPMDTRKKVKMMDLSSTAQHVFDELKENITSRVEK